MKTNLPKRLAFVFAALCLALPTVVAGERVLTLDPAASEVTFELDTTLHLVHGEMYLTSGGVRFDLDTGTASGEIVLDARRTETGNDGRDRKMHGSVLESALYPIIVFRPKRVTGNLGADDSGSVRLEGDVEIHGGTHPLAIDAAVATEAGRTVGTATFAVPYVEWGMKNPSLLILRVAKEVEVTLRAVGRVEPAGTAANTAHLP